MLILFKAQQAVEKLRCILPLPHLFPSLARCFVSLRTLWAYGFDSAAQRALEKKIFCNFPICVGGEKASNIKVIKGQKVLITARK